MTEHTIISASSSYVMFPNPSHRTNVGPRAPSEWKAACSVYNLTI